MVSHRIKRGRKDWYYELEKPGVARGEGTRDRKYGFLTRKQAKAAEAQRRIELNRAACLANVSIAPTTLDLLLEKFFALHCAGPTPLAGKTTERYREHKTYLSPELLASEPAGIKRLAFTAEWKRLLQSGGRTRREKTPRPLSAKTVNHIASMVSSAYNWGARQEFWTENINPVKFSERPKSVKREALALAPSDAMRVLSADGGFWCRDAYLHAADSLGARRGEMLALRWSDDRQGEFHIARSLTQFKDEAGVKHLEFKTVKEKKPKRVSIPAELAAVLEEHRARQREFKQQFGAAYQDHDLIFCQEDGAPLRPDSVSASVSLLCRQLGLPKGASLHTLRHTHASALLEAGVKPEVVAARLGHSTIRTTLDIYAHVLNRGADREAAEAYDVYRQKRAAGAKHAERVN